MLNDCINDKDIKYTSLILKHEEDVNVILASIELADFEIHLVSVINREQVLNSCLSHYGAGMIYKSIVLISPTTIFQLL